MNEAKQETEIPAHARVIQMAKGHWVSQAIYVCAKLGLPDLGPRDASELGSETGTHSRSAYRLLRFLASLGFFREVAKGRFENAELASTLCSDHPGRARVGPTESPVSIIEALPA